MSIARPASNVSRLVSGATRTAFSLSRGISASASSSFVSASSSSSASSSASAASSSAAKKPAKVAITGSAGQIGYATLFRIASGALLGPDQPIILHCIELPFALNALKGVAMELDDCAFPLLKGIVTTDNVEKGFEDIDYALLIGAKPRGKGQERQDLLKENGKIFTTQGKALNKFAKKSVKIIVVGNPANTNCLIAANNAPDIPAENFSAMTRLDHNRALAQVAQKAKCDVTDIEKVVIWGNHSSTQYPDLSYATIKGKSAKQVLNDQAWVEKEFIPIVQKRGAAVIEARGSSSAASAGNAAIDHIHDWALGSHGKWVSMAVPSDGSYGVPKGVYFSYPVITNNGKFEKVSGLKIDEFSAKHIEITKKELFEERDMVKDLLN